MNLRWFHQTATSVRKRGVDLVTRIKFSFIGKPQATVAKFADAFGLPLND